MKRTIFYLAVITILGTCLLLVLKKHEKAPQLQANVQQVGESNGTNSFNPSTIMPATKSASRQPAQAMNPLSNVSTQQMAESLRAAFNTWSNQIQRPIEFYGKVIDENTQPVEGASISFGCSQLSSEAYFETNATSDSAGLFSISGIMGSTLSVQVEKNRYYSVKTNPYKFDYRAVLNTPAFQPDPNNPVVFRLLKKGAGADLISGTMDVKMPRDGTAVYVDFLNKTSGADGQMQISQIKPPYEGWKQATTWSLKMSIPTGGFVEENDEFPFSAPEGGYQPAVAFDFNSSLPDWKTYFTKNYYFVFGSPPRYGCLTVETDITWASARITYTFNPDGSRNLEPKSSNP
jgi:hypothetical protein